LKKFILMALVAYGVGSHYTKNEESIKDDKPALIESQELISEPNSQPIYQCDGRQYCSEMSSYEEAKYFIENCPNTKMDGDNDGIPCERQFSY